MKFPIKWHEENLKNFIVSLDGYKKQIERLMFTISQMEDEAEFRRLQISTAIKKGKDSFDGDRFLVARK